MVHRTAFDSSLEELKRAGLLRDPRAEAVRQLAATKARDLGLELLDVSSNDYLGLARSAHVSRETFGSTREPAAWGSGASRLIHGTYPEHLELETLLAEWVGAESALLFTSGFAANVGVIPAVVGEGETIFSDALNHASIIDGCRLSRAQIVKVRHLDLGHLEELLRQAPAASAKWFVTESYFSMDGDGPDLTHLIALCHQHGAGVIVDEAHALGVFGPRGAGRCAEQGLLPDILVGTLGKSVGTQGAFVASSESVRSWLWNRCRSQMFSTAPSPRLCEHSLFHVKHIWGMDAHRAHLTRLGEQLRQRLREARLNVLPSFGPIVPVQLGGNERSVAAAKQLLNQGILVQAIRPPTVPEGTARLRITLHAALQDSDVDRLANAVAAAATSS